MINDVELDEWLVAMFPPFLRFWWGWVCWISVGRWIYVSTLLEILADAAHMVLAANMVEFQPFLRFWIFATWHPDVVGHNTLF